MAHNYDVGTQAWQPDQTEGWVASEVEQKIVNGDKVKLVFSLANGEVSSPDHKSQPAQQDRALTTSAAVENYRDYIGSTEQ